jgi:ATPase subunit of ABC transporter with duplicated ATPase domains
MADALARLTKGVQELEERSRARAEELRAATQTELVKKGRKAEDLNQFDALSKIASSHEAARTALVEARTNLKSLEDDFASDEAARGAKLAEHRAAIMATMEVVNATNKTVKVSLAPGARRDVLDAWVKSIRDVGVTRWSNDHRDVSDPAQVYAALRDDKLAIIGMSATVASRFKELITEDRRYELRALRSEDRYRVEARVDGGDTFRPLEKLSGGKQVSVLLSLLLETNDNTPLIIDQPEDELDKAFLADTLLPILRRLKGKRQVILATHDANIVVNGDADQVLHLDGSNDRGELRCQGAIDDHAVRQAVLTILDGGRDAFDLRRRKYKF